MTPYWLFDWLDERGLVDAKSTRAYIASEKGLDSLIEALPPFEPRADDVQSAGNAIVAGRGLDLSGELDCMDAECRRRQADDLFRHVWHYFDTIVVEDAVAGELRKHDLSKPDPLRHCLSSHFELLHYLRRMGGDQLLTFKEKLPACPVHWKQHAEEAGISTVVDDFDELASRLVSEGEFRISHQSKAVTEYVFDHPEFEHSVWIEIPRSEAASMTDEEVQRAVADGVLERYLSHLSADVLGAKIIGAPLGSILSLHRVLLQRRPPSVAATAFELDLPILDNVSTEDLIRVRLDERDMFDRFQASLRRAIKEAIKVSDSSRSVEIAAEIRSDIIDPELARIRQRLNASERVLSQKSAVALGVGALATVAGVISGAAAPLVASAGVGSTLTMGGAALNKYLDEQREIADSDYYFLWKASKH